MRAAAAAIVLFFVINCSGVGFGDSKRGHPWTMVVGCKSGRYYLKLIPDSETTFGKTMATAVVYKAGPAPFLDVEVWRGRMWWNAVYLSNGGEHVVWIGADPYFKNAIEFYRRDKMVRAYKIADLVKDGSKLRTTAGGWVIWRSSEVAPSYSLDPVFRLVTTDNIEYYFDGDGRIVQEGVYKTPSN